MNQQPDIARLQEKAVDTVLESMENTSQIPDGLETFRSVEVGPTPNEVVYAENKLELLHYESEADEQHDVPILIVYALINRPYILDLQRDRSVVRTLLDSGFDVYLINWGEPSTLDVHLTLDDYVNRYIDNCVDVVRERSGQERINLLGYCMGGSMSAMYAAQHPEKVCALGLMAAALNFDGSGGILEQWGDEEYYSAADVTGTFGNTPAEFLQVGFDMMDPVKNYYTKYLHLFDNIDDDEFVENFARMEQWLSDGIDVAGATYEQFIQDIYQENKLMRNELSLNGKPVDVENIAMPVLQIVGTFDHLVPPEASKPFNEVVASDDTEIIEFPTGHIGLSVSSKSHEDLWPRVSRWFAERSQVAGAEPGTDTDAATDEEAAVDASEAKAESEEEPPLTAIKGVGPTYAERLRAAGIDSIEALAATDTSLAAEIEVPPGQVQKWINRAQSRVRENESE